MDRIEALDVLRGFAVLGIFLRNIQDFAMIQSAGENPASYGSLTGVEWACWLFIHLFASAKFITLFNLLFGAGILMVWERSRAAGSRPALFHLRRMAGLGLIGALHAYLIWEGDVLVSYALCGLLLFPLRGRSWGLLLAAASVLIVFRAWFMWDHGARLAELAPGEKVSLLNAWRPDPRLLVREVMAYHQDWWRQLPNRARTALDVQISTFYLQNSGRLFGIMILGMALYKSGFLTGKCPPRLYGWTAAAGLGIGLPLVAAGTLANAAHHWEYPFYAVWGRQFNYWGSLPVCLGYIGLLLWLRARGARLSFLAPVGRMTLSNYVMQSVIGTLIFYGYGLGEFGLMGRPAQLGVVAAVWAFQIALSGWWLSRFRQGPLEWLWRWISYGRRPAFRAAAGAAARKPGKAQRV